VSGKVKMSMQLLIDIASKHGHLECLRFLIENKAPVDNLATEWAARNGHLECLRFLIENKAPGYKDYIKDQTKGIAECYQHLKN